jgi:DNA-directed RNA polymerase subunit E'/Rpb7
MFSSAVIRYTVKLQAKEVGSNVRAVIEDRARSLLEGVCGESGYVRPNSLRMVSVSPGRLGDIDMGRSYSFDATFKAEVCNPVRGLRMTAIVRSMNRFGMLCEGGYYDPDNSLVPVIEIVVVRNPATIPNEVDLSDLQVGDEVGVEVLGRSFELRDSRISAFGRTVRDPGDATVLRSESGDASSETDDGDSSESMMSGDSDESDGSSSSEDAAESAAGGGDAEDGGSSGGGYSESDVESLEGFGPPGVNLDEEGFDMTQENSDVEPDT